MSNRQFRDNVQLTAASLPEYSALRYGVTGKSDGAGNFDPNASVGLPDGQTWVLLDGERDSIPCDNLVVNPYSPGIDVKTEINIRTKRREIRGVFMREGSSISATDLRIAAVPVPLAFDADKIAIGKVEPSSERGGTWIFVRAFQHDGGSFLSGERQYYDLSAEIAAISSGASVMVIVGVDTATNEIDVTVGTENSLIYAYSPEDAEDIATAAGIVRLAALVLKDGQTLAADCFGQNPPRYFDQRQFLNLAGGTASAFTDLTDVPNSYSGQAGKFVVVNATEDELEFVTSAASEVGAKLRRVGTVLHDETLGSSGSFDVTSISQDYDDLEVILEGRSDANSSGGVNNFNFSLNNDTTDANYHFQQISGSGSTASAITATQRLIGAVPGADATAGKQGLTHIFIPDYTRAIFKQVQALFTTHNTTRFAIFRSMEWQDTSAINRITVAVANADTDFETGTRLRIIGWKTEAIGGLDNSDANVSNPPTDAELDSAFGTPASVGDGFAAIVDDNGADTAVWFVASNGTSWWTVAMTKAT